MRFWKTPPKIQFHRSEDNKYPTHKYHNIDEQEKSTLFISIVQDSSTHKNRSWLVATSIETHLNFITISDINTINYRDGMVLASNDGNVI